jgi:peptide/nickel transport system substrate-binding protein
MPLLAGCSGGSDQDTTSTTSVSGDDTTTDDTQTTEQKQSQTLVYSRANFINHLDPHGPGLGNDDIKVQTQIYDQLTAFKPGTTEIQAGLATKWEIDGTTVTFKLREGVKFHNGDELTADDFVATYRRYTDKEYEYYFGEDVNSYGLFTFSMLKGATADGDYSLTIELKQKFAPILRNLAMWSGAVLPKSVIEQGENFRSNPVGTGPFSLDQLNENNQRIRLAANTDWWGNGPHVDQLVFNTIDKNSTRVQSLLRGESHIIDGLTPSTAGQAKQGQGVELRTKPGGNIGNLAMNLAVKPELRDPNVRKAFFYAINTQSLVENVYSGYAENASQPLPPTMMGYNEELEPYPHDVEQAQSLMQKSEYPDGFDLELTVFQNARTYHPAPLQTAQVVKSNLNEIGVNVTINQMPFGSWITYVLEGKHEAALAGWVTDNADPDNILYQLLDPGIPMEDLPEDQNWVSRDHPQFQTYNMVSWVDLEFIKLVRDARTTYDEQVRVKKYKQANKIAYDRGPWVNIANVEQLRGVSQQVSNYHVTAVIDPNLQTVKLQN